MVGMSAQEGLVVTANEFTCGSEGFCVPTCQCIGIDSVMSVTHDAKPLSGPCFVS